MRRQALTGPRTSHSGNGAQVELGANYVVRDVDLSIRGTSNKPAFDQHAYVFMNSLDVPLELARQPPDAARSEFLQSLDQLPTFGGQHTKQRRRRLEFQSVARRLARPF